MTATDAALWLIIPVGLGASAIKLLAYARFLRGGRAAEDAARAALDSAADRLRDGASADDLLEYFRRQLDQFQIQGRRRANWSFAASLIAMFAGLGLVGVAVFSSVRNPEQVMPTVAGVASTALTCFIVSTFVELSRQADRSLDPLFKEAARSLRFLMVRHLVDSLEDSPLREPAVEALVQQFLDEIREDDQETGGRGAGRTVVH
jgi:hypothetical protein